MNNLSSKLTLIFLLLFSFNTSAGTLYGIDRANDALISVDTTTFSATTIGSLGVNEEFGGLAYDPNNDIMYMSGGRNNNSIYTVNYSTGAATILGAHGINDVFGLAFDSTNNILYGTTTNNNIYSFSQVNGSATLIGNTSFNLGGLAYDSTQDRLIAIRTGGTEIFEINSVTGAATSLQTALPSTNDVGFTYDFENNLFYSYGLNGTIHEYNPVSFSATQKATGLPAVDGLTFVGVLGTPQQIPSLSSWGLMLLIILFGFFGFSRRTT